MALIVDGTEIKNTYKINYNGTSLDKIVCDGVTVWERLPVNTVQLSKISSYVYGSARGTTTAHVTKLTIEISESLSTPLFYIFSARQNNAFVEDIWHSSIAAGETTTTVEFSPEKTYELAGTSYGDSLFLYLSFYTMANGVKMPVDINGTGSSSYKAAEITGGGNVSLHNEYYPADVYVPE